MGKDQSMIMELFDNLFPICRSITGNGVRKTLDILKEIVDLEQKEYASGTQCFDWVVPKEWNIRDAYIKNSKGEKLIDFNENNLHIVNYSVPFHGKLTKDELMEHIYTLPEIPDAIPYVTSYYKERWGFCIAQNQLSKFNDSYYEVYIDSSLEDGYLTIGEGFLKGQSSKEVLFSTYICHPSMANNELSGIIVQTFIYKYLKERGGLKYSYRFLYLPETIGSILYLNQYGDKLKQNVIAGYVISCVGDNGPFTYKKSRRGNTLADRAAINTLSTSEKEYKVIDWFPLGSDERQYCSIGFNLPIGSLMRSMYGTYKEYHTSLDNKNFISEEAIQESIDTYIKIIETIELNDKYITNHVNCEPKLDKRGIYPNMGGQKYEELKMGLNVKNIMYLWAFSDGEHDIIDIANKLNLPGYELRDDIVRLQKAGLLVSMH